MRQPVRGLTPSRRLSAQALWSPCSLYRRGPCSVTCSGRSVAGLSLNPGRLVPEATVMPRVPAGLSHRGPRSPSRGGQKLPAVGLGASPPPREAAPELPTRPRAAPAPWSRVAPRCCLHFPLPLGMDWLSMDTGPGHHALPCGHHGCRGDSLGLSPVAGPIVGLRLLHICWWFEKLSRSLSVLRAGF